MSAEKIVKRNKISKRAFRYREAKQRLERTKQDLTISYKANDIEKTISFLSQAINDVGTIARIKIQHEKTKNKKEFLSTLEKPLLANGGGFSCAKINLLKF